MVALLLHTLHLKVSHDVVLSSLGDFPDILFKTLSKSSMDTLITLYKYIISGNDVSLDRGKLLLMLHQLWPHEFVVLFPMTSLPEFPHIDQGCMYDAHCLAEIHQHQRRLPMHPIA